MRKKGIIPFLVASALLANGSIALANPETVTTPTTPVPISAPVELQAGVIAKEINEKTDLITVKMRIPQLVGMSDPHFQDQFNYLRELHAQKAITEAKKTLEEMDAYNKANGYPHRPVELQMNFELKSTGAILSFTVTEYSYLGGANGITTATTYNIDTKENHVISSLVELLKDGTDYQSVINAKIAAEIKTRLTEMPSSYFEGEMGFKGINDFQGFYLQGENLVIVFPKYEIAPGATGIPEFSIPMADLQELLKDDDQEQEPAEEVVSRHVTVTPIVNEAGVKMIPLRKVCEGLGYQVTWHDESQTAEVVRGAQWTQVFIGQDNYSFAKMLIRLGTAPILKDGITYVPASFAEQVLKATVSEQDGVLTISQ